MSLNETLPSELRNLRACLVCGLIKTEAQFINNGCENCEDYVNIGGDRDAVLECTSQNFQSIVVVTDPTQSWVARWLSIDRLYPGTYALSVSGKLADHRIDSLARRGIVYVSRDRSKP